MIASCNSVKKTPKQTRKRFQGECGWEDYSEDGRKKRNFQDTESE